jgi:hypothetical protein
LQDFGSELVRALLQSSNTSVSIQGAVVPANGFSSAEVNSFVCQYDDFCLMFYNATDGTRTQVCSGTQFKAMDYTPPPCPTRVQALGSVDQPGQSVMFSSDEIAQPLGSVILPAQPAQPVQPAKAPADTIASTLGSIIQPFLAAIKRPAQTAEAPEGTTAQAQDAQGFEEVNS